MLCINNGFVVFYISLVFHVTNHLVTVFGWKTTLRDIPLLVNIVFLWKIKMFLIYILYKCLWITASRAVENWGIYTERILEKYFFIKKTKKTVITKNGISLRGFLQAATPPPPSPSKNTVARWLVTWKTVVKYKTLQSYF